MTNKYRKSRPSPETVRGTVVTVYEPNQAGEEGNTYWRPGKIIIATSPGVEEELTIFPADDGGMPEFWYQLVGDNPDALVGTVIESSATKMDIYKDRQQWKPQTIGVVPRSGGDAYKEKVKDASVRPTPALDTPYAPVSRQEHGMAIGNARTNSSVILAAYIRSHNGEQPPSDWLDRAVALVLHSTTTMCTPVEDKKPEPVTETQEELQDLEDL